MIGQAKYDRQVDRCSQHTGSGWITTLTEAKIKISMDSGGHYLDYIIIKGLWRSPMQYAVYLHELTDSFQGKYIIDT
jgi:putative transposase